jgi:uncharacterized protein (DUF1778 family)
LPLYVSLTYTLAVQTKSARWTVRVTHAQDAAVRRVLDATGESLNEYVVRHAVEAAHQDLADRRVFMVDDAAWNELQALLDRPPAPKPELAKLLARPSVLEERQV